MTVPASAVAPARAALFTLLNANATFSGDATVAVIFDAPALGDETRFDYVSLGDVAQTEKPFAIVGSGGGGWTMETFTIDVTVSVFRAGDQAQTVFERCWALINAVRTTIRDDPTLSATVVQSWPESWDVQSTWDEQTFGRWAVGKGRVYCDTQL